MFLRANARIYFVEPCISSSLLFCIACPQVVEEIFRERIQRDVVIHSGKLLQFLCGMEDKLTPEHIDLIWSSCVKESSAELQVWEK